MFSVKLILLVVVGVSSGSPTTPKILGGSDADIADFPFMLSIELEGTGHYCGGVIVSSNWALTDGWCTPDPANVTQFSVRSGSDLLGNGTLHSVLQWIYHPQIDLFYNEYDFALIQVDPAFEFGENVAAVTLPAQNQSTPDGAVAFIAGWGEVYESYNWTTPRLQFANITLLGETACSDYLTFEYADCKLCARDPAGEVAHCFRDEGGPLVVDGTLYGIAIWPGVCNDPLEVQLYSRVASIREWIDDTVGP